MPSKILNYLIFQKKKSKKKKLKLTTNGHTYTKHKYE